MRLKKHTLAALAILALPTTALVARQAAAWPTNSPSARAAARLKYNPPKNWIRHYLGDDRYKIAGGVWNVVSTQADTYYHRPTCPNMLRQSADIVIGFNKSDEATEAGYIADPTCQPGASAYIYDVSGAPSASPGSRGPISTFSINRSRKAQRIVLSDGVSTILLPPNWKRTQIEAKVTAGKGGELREQADLIQPVRGQGHIVIGFETYPATFRAQQVIDMVKGLVSALGTLGKRSGAVNNQLEDLQKINTTSITLGGLKGVSLKTPGMKMMAEKRTVEVSTLMAAARGNKLYVLGTSRSSSDSAGFKTIINSFRPG